MHASHEDPRCLHPTGDHVCLHTTGTPGACIPWGSVFACIPRGPWGTRVRLCHRRSSSTSPCSCCFPRRVPLGDLWARRRAAGETCVSPVDKETLSPEAADSVQHLYTHV